MPEKLLSFKTLNMINEMIDTGTNQIKRTFATTKTRCAGCKPNYTSMRNYLARRVLTKIEPGLLPLKSDVLHVTI